MEMSQLSKKVLLASGIVFLSASVFLTGTADADDKWEKAGKEIVEAAGAVTDATKDTSSKTWQKTKEGSIELYEKAGKESGEIWDKTKEVSSETWDSVKEGSEEAWQYSKKESKEVFERAKSEVHDATAPKPSDASHPE